MKKTISIILSLVMMLSAFQITAFSVFADELESASGETANYTWSFDADASTMSFTLKASAPDDYVFEDEKEMTDPDHTPKWTTYMATVTTVKFPAGISGISKIDAISGNKTLEYATIPTSAVIIASDAFADCTNLDVAVQKNVQKIGDNAFKNVKRVRSINFEKIQEIGANAFNGVSLLNVDINSNDLTAIGDGAFSNIHNLAKVAITSESLTSVPAIAFAKCSKLENLEINAPIDTIGAFAFQNTAITSMGVDVQNVVSIGDYAYEYTNIAGDLEFSDKLEYLGSGSFVSTDITSVSFADDSIDSIGDEAFAFCTSLTKATLPAGLKTINASAFRRDTALKSANLPDTLKEIGENAFDNTAIKSIAIPDSLTRIRMEAFYNSKLTSVTIPSTVQKVEKSAFAFNPLTTVNVNTPFIGEKAFADCNKLSKVNIGSDVVRISDSAFKNCDALKSIAIPATATNLSERIVPQSTIIKGDDGSAAAEYAEEFHNKFYSTHDHDYMVVVKNATCTTAGKKTFTCKDCDYSYTEKIAIDKHAHDYQPFVYRAYGTRNGYTADRCTRCKAIKNKKIVYRIGSVKLAKKSYKADGKVHKPSVIVKDINGNKISSKYYTVKYHGSCKKVGTYNVTISFKGNYGSEVLRTFKIVK